MEQIEFGAIIAGIILILKITFKIKKRFIPAISFLVSFACFAVYLYIEHLPLTWKVIATAAAVSFTAGGIWSHLKTTFGDKS